MERDQVSKSHLPFFGLLTRIGPNQWQWVDGTPEPRVRDLTIACFYRFRRVGDRIAVPKYQVQRNPVLAWAKRYPIGVGEHRGYYMVRELDWESTWANTVIGARWERYDSDALVEKAEQLRSEVHCK